MKKFTLKLFMFLLLFAVAKSMSAETVKWVASEQGYANAQEVLSFDIDDVVSVTADKGSNSNGPKYYNTGSAWRLYGGNKMTINSGSAVITEIVFTFASGENDNAILADVGEFDKDTWTGSSNEVTFTIDGTKGHRRFASISVTYSDEGGGGVTVKRPTISPESGTYTEMQTVTISVEDGLSAFFRLNDDYYFVEYFAPFTVSETTTIEAYAQDADGNRSSIVTTTITIVDLGDLKGSGTAADPYDVASALKLINAGVAPKNEVYVKGVVSSVDASSWSSEYKTLIYFISDDGTTTSPQLEVYRGKGLGNVGFESADALKANDNVVVYGKLTLFGTTPEFTSGSYLFSLNSESLVTPPTISPASGVYNEAQTVTITAENGLSVFYSFDNETFQAYSAPFTVSETTTVYAYAQDAGGKQSATVSATITISTGEEQINGSGTKEDPYDVASALSLITSGKIPTDKVYVKGKISKIDKVNTQYGDATYYISDDGSANKQLEVFQGKYLNNANFTSESQIKVNDQVVVYGKLTFYNNTTPEFEKGNYIYELNGSTTPPIDATYNTIAEAKAAATADKKVVQMNLTGVTVTFVKDQSTYIADATDGFLLFGKELGMNTGEVVDVKVTGELYLYNGLPELSVTKVDNLTVKSEGVEITPTIVEIADLKDDPMKYSNMLVKVEGASYDAAEFTDRNVTIYQEGEDAVVRDNWNVAVTAEFDTDEEYDVIGFVAIYTKDGNTTIQLYPRSIEDLGVEKKPLNIEGEGTMEKPYTVNDVLQLYLDGSAPEDEVWVKGIIVGNIAGTSIKNAVFNATDEKIVATNVLIADDASANDVKVCLPVKLPADPKDADGNIIPSVRGKVNIKDHPENLGKEVMFLGKIQACFTVAGLADVKDAIIDGEHASGIIDINADNNTANGKIYTIAGQRVDQITRGGIYIINGKKVLVK